MFDEITGEKEVSIKGKMFFFFFFFFFFFLNLFIHTFFALVFSSYIHHYFNIFHEFKALKKVITTKTFNVDFYQILDHSVFHFSSCVCVYIYICMHTHIHIMIKIFSLWYPYLAHLCISARLTLNACLSLSLFLSLSPSIDDDHKHNT